MTNIGHATDMDTHNTLIPQYEALPVQDFDGDLFRLKWLEYNMDLSKATIKGYETTIRAFILWLSENDIHNPVRSDIVKYRDYLTGPHMDPRTGKEVTFTADTAARYFRGVKMFFNFLDDNGLYTNISRGVRDPKTNRTIHKREALTREEVLTLLNETYGVSEKELRDYCIILLIILCGLRVSEVATADVGDIKERGADVRLYVKGKGHTSKDDYKKLPRTLWQPLKYYITKRKAGKSDPLFVSVRNNLHDYGDRLTSESVSRIVKRALVKSGFNDPSITAHSLRHTSVTLDREAGATLEEAQRHARHVDISTTQIYDHSLEKKQAADEQRISDYLFGKD